ncbi:polysaccharide deacetylase family protein [Terricaulis silvestris]|uniref:Chitooligosaccharide deacetylase n=1 Tax=Terricaulis silvestris TaxID=2686094 RepID=A0A6I6MIA0_9CAUL|nr:polysaccharide deacetylase family protein [Terricaulis silvestris]QGZ94780.1 chitooligosaccharide deacetylase NodB [Terricaulis silvestris]
MTMTSYAPSRDALSKVQRRWTQWRAARPANLRFDEPILSITFDDFPVSAGDLGARILESHGARGTFYAAAGLAETDGPCGSNFNRDDIPRLIAAGHEIGCHTYDHGDCAKRGVYDTLRGLAKNRDALNEMGAYEPSRTLAYPYGETQPKLKASLPPRFYSARGILPGLNLGRTDLAQLRSYPMFGEGGMARVCDALKRAAKRKAWLIAFTHDISDTPSPWGTSAADLDALLKAAKALGVVVMPVTPALERRLS